MNITKINVNGEEYYIQDTISGYTSFEWNRNTEIPEDEDKLVGTMVFNGVSYPVYAPTQSMSNTLDIEVNGTDLTITHGDGEAEQLITIIENYSLDIEEAEPDYHYETSQTVADILEALNNNDTIRIKASVGSTDYYFTTQITIETIEDPLSPMTIITFLDQNFQCGNSYITHIDVTNGSMNSSTGWEWTINGNIICSLSIYKVT